MDFCRICIENKGTTDIFHTIQGVSVCSKIMYCCANICIQKEDGLPTRICSACDIELSLSYQFVLKCEAAHKRLQSLSSMSINLEDDVKLEIKVEDDQTEFYEIYIDEPSDNTSPKIPDESPTLKVPDPIPNVKRLSSMSINLEDDVKLEIKVEDDQTEFDDIYIDEPSDNASPKIPDESPTLKVPDPIPNVKRLKINSKPPKDDGQKKCKECGKSCSSQSTLMIHMRTHSDARPYACTSCDKKYKDRGGLNRHIESNHNDTRKRNFICEFCGKGFYSHSAAKTHMRIHTGETPYACPSCPLKFTQITSLLRHKIRHTGEKPHSCSKCNKSFHTKEEMTRHETTHTSEKKFTCIICNVRLKNSNSLRKHVLQHSLDNHFICDHCGQTFKNKGNLKIHLNRKHSVKSGNCHVCFKDVPNIEVHMWRHTGRRPFKCDLCPKSFFVKKALTLHKNFYHIYSDKYKCIVDGCTSSFPTQPMLKFHIAKFHVTSIPFPCDKCSKGFYRKCDLTNHMLRIHTEVQTKR